MLRTECMFRSIEERESRIAVKSFEERVKCRHDERLTPLRASTSELFPADWLPMTAMRGKSIWACALLVVCERPN